MDTISEGIIAGVVANCITETVGYLINNNNSRTVGKNTRTVIHEAIIEVSEKIEIDESFTMENVVLFIQSPEVESIIRQLISISVVGISSNKRLDLIQKEFIHSFALCNEVSLDNSEEIAKRIFKALVKQCESGIQEAVEKGVLSAHDAKSTLRFRILLDALDNIEKNITFLSEPNLISIDEIEKFEESYKRQVNDRHKYIIPPNFDEVKKVPLDDLYVTPNFLRKMKKGEETEEVKGNQFIANTYRSVILGDPGSGKSTFSQKLCYELSSKKENRCFCGKNVAPILVILRDYGAEKKSKGCSILEFVELTANSKYQIKAPIGAFEYLEAIRKPKYVSKSQ